MAEIPNLAGIATADLMETIKGAGSFKASYINWSRTVNLLRENAPGWLPELVTNEHGSVLHRAPVGAYLLIRFRHTDGTATPEVPQAIMDNSNKAIPLDRIDARDITDTHRRGVCLAAAFTFGLAYELWAKIPLESGFADNEKPAQAEAEPMGKVTPLDGVWDAIDPDEQAFLLAQAEKVKLAFADGGPALAAQLIYRDLKLTNDEITGMWTQLPSHIRNPSKKFKDQFTHKELAA
ncbi:MAG: hypothetical protein M3Q51_00385 [Pseudomonadota bacterium]|nr:hypothetical protein [Pseudomonadota bacterium]